MDEEKAGMVPGKRYRITLKDCCIEGEIFGTFVEWQWPENWDGGRGEDDRAYQEAIFDIGRIGPAWGKWRVKEA